MHRNEDTRVSRSDWIVLPVVSIVTILSLLGAAELVSRHFWPQAEESNCFEDSAAGRRFRPNCTSNSKALEGPWAPERFNECGYRTDAPCGKKPAGTLRIVLLGSSTTEGLFIPYDQTFGARVGRAVSRDFNRPVQVENLGVRMLTPLSFYKRIPEVISLQPDVVVYSLALDDLKNKIDLQELNTQGNRNVGVPTAPAPKPATVMQRLHNLLFQDSTSSQVAQHFFFRNTDRFIKASLAYGDKGSFLKQPDAPVWNERFSALQVVLEGMTERLKAQGIPLVLMAVPSRVEAALFRPSPGQTGVNAFAFGERVREVAEKSGVAAYVDLMRPFSALPRPEDLYFVVNSHLTGEGQEAVARQLTPTVERILRDRMQQQDH